MRRDLLDILACPTCKAPLDLSVDREEADEIIAGKLTCTECGAAYPIEDSIPNLLPASLREAAR